MTLREFLKVLLDNKIDACEMDGYITDVSNFQKYLDDKVLDSYVSIAEDIDTKLFCIRLTNSNKSGGYTA